MAQFANRGKICSVFDVKERRCNTYVNLDSYQEWVKLSLCTAFYMPTGKMVVPEIHCVRDLNAL